MNNNFLLKNPYENIIIKNTMIHYGNGAKDELKKENKSFNFKFYYDTGSKIKFCSCGFDDLDKFKKFIKPIKNKYYIFEYMMENKKCCPYFDYEYEIEKQPTKKELCKQLNDIILLIKNIFDEVLKIKLKNNTFRISSSHGFKKENLFKISFHINIIGYYFDSNYECKYLCDILHKKNINFDTSVYSKDRMMRTVLSYKDWSDDRQFIAIDYKHSKIDINIDNLDEYLITNIKNNYIKLNVPISIKTKILKYKYKTINKLVKTESEIGFKLQQIIQQRFHEDVYYTKSTVKMNDNKKNKEFNDIVFYSFNYNDRNKICFTGYKHDRLGFYCYIDNLNNIILKCFSEKCKKSKFIIGNLNDTMHFEKSLDIKEKYVTNSSETINVMDKLKSNLKSFIIKSGMGTAKTELLIKYIKNNNPKRILILSTRQSYANNIYQRLDKLNFINYLDDKLNFHTKNRIIVQLESLHHLTRDILKPFDLIVLDEIESILYNFSSETIMENTRSTFDLLCKICEQQKTKLIAMDADYNIRSHEFMKYFGNYKMIQNFHKNEIIKIELTNNLNFFIDDIKKTLLDKQKICIIGLSTKILYQLEELFKEIGVKYILHTRDSDDLLKKELIDVNKLWSKYQAVLYSPTISVGVDHTQKYFDKVYSIIVPNCASPRVYLQMLGRIRNMKKDSILTYYQNVNTSVNKILYNIEDVKDYLKYVDNNFKATKKYEVDEDGNLYAYVDDDELYNKIMMHNKIENLNKINEYFMTCLNMLCNENNYKLVFLENKNDYKSVELNDDVYKNKIINADDINCSEFSMIAKNINNNCATENEKFSFQKYRFKKFWKINTITDENIEMYFRKEKIMNNLMLFCGEKIIDDKYIDYNSIDKLNILEMIIKTLGFDKNKLDIKLSRDEYYKNIKKLLSNSEFSKNYDKIRTMFNRPKTKLNVNLKGPNLAKFINGYFEEFGLYIFCEKKQQRINNKRYKKTSYILTICKKYLKIIEKYNINYFD